MDEGSRQVVAAIYAAFCGASGDKVRRQANASIAYALEQGSIPNPRAQFVLREIVLGNSLEFDDVR